MKRRQFLAVLAAGALAAAPVFADDMVAAIVRQLKQQGFDTVTTESDALVSDLCKRVSAPRPVADC